MDVEHLDVVLDAKLGPLFRNLARADARAEKSEEALGRVRVTAGQAAESDRAVRRITTSLGSVPRQALEASERLERVKLAADQAVESAAAADVIDRQLKHLRDKAFLTERGLGDVKITETQASESEVAGGRIERILNRIARAGIKAKLAGGRNGAGVGPFGSGFGRIGLLGTAIGGGALLGPAAGPAALGGVIAAATAGAPAAAGALGVLALAFAGVGKAIGGDKKAYDALQPAQQQFVMTVRSLDGWLNKLKQTAGSSLFPGLTAGLQAALSPGTLGQVNAAVREFGSAIGQAGKAWGQYFGSGQFQQLFGPLMASGAHTITVLSDATLHLFDALGVVLRAAIPLTTWMTTAIDRGSRVADMWLRSKDASGALGRAMDEARASLQLVGGLLVSIGRAVYALGAALYPVSKIAVAELTVGLDALAEIIHRNEGVIRSIIGTALVGLVVSLSLVAKGLEKFTDGLRLVIGEKAKVVTAVLAIGTAIALTLGPEAAVIVGVILAVGLIAKNWDKLSKFMPEAMRAAWSGIKGIFDLGVYAMLLSLDMVVKGVKLAFGWLPFIGPQVQSALSAVDGYIEGFRTRGIAEFSTAGSQMGAAWGASFGTSVQDALRAAQAAQLAGMSAIEKQGFSTPLRSAPKPKKKSALDKLLAQLANPDTASPFGKAPPFDKNLGPKTAFTALPAQLAAQLANAQSNAASGGLPQLRQLEQVEKRALAYLDASKATGKNLVAVAKERLRVTRLLAATEKAITQTEAGRREEKILGLAPGGGAVTPGRTTLRLREHKILEDQIGRSLGGKKHSLAVAAQAMGVSVTTLLSKTNDQLIAEMRRMGIAVPKATLDSLRKINLVLKEKFLPPDVRENIKARLAQIEETLKSSSKTLASNYKPVHSTDIVKGLGLDRAQKLAVEQRVSQALAHGGRAPSGGAAAGVPLTVGGKPVGTTTINGGVKIVIEGAGKTPQEIAREVRTELLKHGQRNARVH